MSWPHWRRTLLLAAVLLVSGAGCVQVRPWQRQVLAQPGLQEPLWPQVRAGQQHVYSIREGSEGGFGTAGGGCGCN